MRPEGATDDIRSFSCFASEKWGLANR